MMWNVNQELLFLLVFHVFLAVCQRKPQKALEQVNGVLPAAIRRTLWRTEPEQEVPGPARQPEKGKEDQFRRQGTKRWDRM